MSRSTDKDPVPAVVEPGPDLLEVLHFGYAVVAVGVLIIMLRVL